VAGCVDGDQRCDHDETRRVGDEHHRAAVGPVGQRTSHEHGGEDADALECEDQAKRASGAGQRERSPAESDDEGRVAEQRNGLAGPEQPEVAALEGLQDAGAGGCGSGRFHRSKAILTP
jgi:hypothetical protein